MKTRLSILFAILLLPLCSGFADDFLNEAVGATPVAVKATPGRLYGWGFTNLSSAPAYVHFYDAATIGAVTVGTTAQACMVPVPQSGAFYFPPNGAVAHVFTTGIVIAVTTSPLSSGSTAPSAGVVSQVYYQ